MRKIAILILVSSFFFLITSCNKGDNVKSVKSDNSKKEENVKNGKTKNKNSNNKSKDESNDKKTDVVVSVKSEEKKEEKIIEAFGIVKATKIKNVTLDFLAVIDKVYVKRGERVKFGDVLFTIFMDDLEFSIKDKEYELVQAKLDLQKLKFELKKMYNDLELSNEKLKSTMKELIDNTELLKMGGASQKNVDDLKTKVNECQKEKDNLEMSIQQYTKSVPSVIEVQYEKIKNIEYRLNQLKRKLNRPNIKQNKVIVDLENGIIDNINFRDGSYIQPENSVLTIFDADSIIVEANVPEEFIKDIKIGNKATVLPVADTNRKYTGKISRISRVARDKNGETVVPVEVVLDKKDDFLFPNFNVDVTIKI